MHRTRFPPIRACIFDVDGLLINSEDIYIQVMNDILHEKYGTPRIPWRIIARQQSRGSVGLSNVLAWAQVDLPTEDFRQQVASRRDPFKETALLPGVQDLLIHLYSHKPDMSLALATSARREYFQLKTGHLPLIEQTFGRHPIICGDDASMVGKKGKPAPDIFLLALANINERREAIGLDALGTEECLVFEDSTAGVEAARRAGMRCVWVPHPGLRGVYRGKEEFVMMGKTDDLVVEELDSAKEDLVDDILWSEDGRVQVLRSLQELDLVAYGLK